VPWGGAIGLAALAVVEVLRWDRRRRCEDAHTTELVALEIAGIAFLIGASPIRVIQGSTWAGLTGVVLGVLIAGWGALTRVRRRLWLGVASAVGCLLLMVLVPLASRLPDVASATLWVLLGVIGILVVVAATALERGRTRLRTAMHHLDELLDGWE
jgi:peptidoglycan/LPS O-acetylase OafA/YrhL